MRLTLLTIPLEIRRKIFKNLHEAEHTILIAPRVPAHGPLRPLQLTCKKTNDEVKTWSTTHPSLVDSNFGLIDPSLTTFKMCFSSKVKGRLAQECGILLHNEPRDRKVVQRIFKPYCNSRDLARLAIWKRAMDIAGTNDSIRIGDVMSMVMHWMMHGADFEATPELKQQGRDAAQRLYCLSFFIPNQTYLNTADGSYDKTVLHEDQGLFFKSLSVEDRAKFCVSENWDTHELHQRCWESADGMPASCFVGS
ncbi:hypothetical protein BKA65DRAFT_515219 [Rhexocercosporidium sp. MPI-PUGE-AT-0058]|nr:hypothetical protein BKA65DRAFT_515219 [Rhexocercosporidium sp. MPI-PUGE-AT-0058]